jgi:molecular chaperone GrpE
MPDDNTTNAIPVDDAATAGEVAAMRAKLEATEQELNNYKLRLADFDNARKRLLRDTEVERKYATEPLARDLLNALDNLDRALDAAKRAGDTGPLATGVSATAAQFLEAFKRHGITRIECAPGTPFDPNLHQAVAQQPSDEFAPGQVVQVLQHGFMIHDRVLRPASVIVAAGSE